MRCHFPYIRMINRIHVAEHNKKIHKKDKKFYISLYIFYAKKYIDCLFL